MESVFREELFKEQQDRAANTARLRGLRLAKEAREREAEALLAAEQAAAKTTGKPPTATKARLVKRPKADKERGPA
jgi:hypothetical protein